MCGGGGALSGRYFDYLFTNKQESDFTQRTPNFLSQSAWRIFFLTEKVFDVEISFRRKKKMLKCFQRIFISDVKCSED